MGVDARRSPGLSPRQRGPLARIYDKVMENKRLSFDDGVTLWNSDDLAGIGALAGVLLGRRNVDVIVIRPEQDLAVRLRSDIVLR